MRRLGRSYYTLLAMLWSWTKRNTYTFHFLQLNIQFIFYVYLSALEAICQVTMYEVGMSLSLTKNNDNYRVQYVSPCPQ